MGLESSPAILVLLAVGFLSFASDVSAANAFFALDPFLEMFEPLQTKSPQCEKEVIKFKDELKKRTLWALQMVDASSKVPSGLLMGNVDELGNFNECLGVRSRARRNDPSVIGKYCYVKVSFNWTRPTNSTDILLPDLTLDYGRGICMPSACSSEDLRQQLEFSMKSLSVSVDNIHCQSSLDDSRVPLTSRIVMYFIVILLVIVSAATWIEHKSIEIHHELTKSVLMSFSLIRNGQMLLSVSPPGRMVDGVDGIRVMSMVAVATIHVVCFSCRMYTVNRYTVVTRLLSDPFGIVCLRGAYIGIDAFFLIGGALTAIGFITDRKAQVPFSYAKHILHRYIRITPPYLFMIVMQMTILYDLGSGPIWDFVVGDRMRGCASSWWQNLLYINNYTNPMCMEQAWYLATDMQLYIIAPMFLLILHKRRKEGVLYILTACATSALYTFQTALRNGYYSVPAPFITAGEEEVTANIHRPVETRMSPYLIGLLLGYCLECARNEKITIQSFSRLVSWTISTVILLGVMFLPPIMYHSGSGPFAFALFESLHRPLTAIAFAWIIFACDQGYASGLNQFLSLHFFQVLSRLSYCFYLSHLALTLYEVGIRREAAYFSYYLMMQRLVFVVVAMVPASAAFSLVVEYPVMHLSKMFLKKESEVTKRLLTI